MEDKETGIEAGLNCVDLFAGAGGFSLSAKIAGFRIRLAIENNRHAVETYVHNLCSGVERAPMVLNNDIAALSPSDIFEQCFETGEVCDLLLGGPPCQGFSTHRIKNAGVDDARNNLIHTYFEFVRSFRPTIFLLENVPGMLWPRHKAYLDGFFDEGRAAGYRVYDPIMLDARDFGVPQRRKRVFILGVKTGTDVGAFRWPPEPTHGNDISRLRNPALQPWKNCQPVFLSAAENDPNNVHMKHSQEIIEAFKRTPLNGGSRRDSGRLLKCHDGHDGHKDVYGRIDPSLPGPTMTTACINPSKGRFVHPTANHGITVRHAARMQTFPDTYIFKGGLMAAGQQVGNAVPVKLGQFLINYIKPLLRGRSHGITERETQHRCELV